MSSNCGMWRLKCDFSGFEFHFCLLEVCLNFTCHANFGSWSEDNCSQIFWTDGSRPEDKIKLLVENVSFLESVSGKLCAGHLKSQTRKWEVVTPPTSRQDGKSHLHYEDKNVSQVGGMEFSLAAAFQTESGSRRASHAISLAYVKHGDIELLSATSVEAAPEHRGVFGGSHHISDAASSGTHMSFSDVHVSSLIFFFNIYTLTAPA
ncbi:hypothetical protein TRVL_09423 [Trypanosoma vivax]|nr:hypothetical protein TRVL_09423 [Trypanosoma vivax]